MLTAVINDIKKYRKGILFIIKFLALYIIFISIYDFILSPHTSIDNNIISLIKKQSEAILTILGYNLIVDESNFFLTGILGTSGVIIGNPCNGLSLFLLFASFVIIFTGKAWFKLLYIILGIIIIHLLNVLRIVALDIIVLYQPSTLDFHHSYTFTLLIYLFIFFLWIFRLKIYKNKKI